MRRHLSLLVVALLLATACADDTSTEAEPESAPTPSPTPSDEPSEEPSEEPVAPYVEVEDGPVGLTATKDGAVWVVAAKGETVQRIPVGGSSPDLMVDVPGTPLRTTAAFGSVWVTSFSGGRLLRLDPATGEVTASLETGEGPEGLTSGFGSVWLVVQDAGRLLRIDPATDEVVADIEITVGARLVAAGPDAIYVSHYRENAVLRIDPQTDEITGRSNAACTGPQSMAVHDGRVWVTCTVSEEVIALDADTLEEVARVPVPGSPDTVAVAPGGLLAVVAEDGPRLVVLDPAASSVVAEQVLGQEVGLYDQANLDLAFAGGEVWVSSFDADRVYRVPLPG
jgi:DNA-binding beta-propeller fold protein YncE